MLNLENLDKNDKILVSYGNGMRKALVVKNIPEHEKIYLLIYISNGKSIKEILKYSDSNFEYSCKI